MWPDRVSNPGPLALESEELPNALRGLAIGQRAKQLIPEEAAHYLIWIYVVCKSKYTRP